MRVLVDAEVPAGGYEEVWDGRDDAGRKVTSGIYFYRLGAGSFTQTKKMVLLRVLQKGLSRPLGLFAACIAIQGALADAIRERSDFEQFIFGIHCRRDAPDEVFMDIELCEGALSSAADIARYEPELGDA